MEQSYSVSQPVWGPNPSEISKLQIDIFRRKHNLESLTELYQKASSDTNWFWKAVCEDLGIVFRIPPTQYFQETSDFSRPQWCSNAKMNIVESALDKWVSIGKGNKTAVTFEDEMGNCIKLSYAELLNKVTLATIALRSSGVRKGSVVALMMPMNIEVVVAFLAIVRCGAIVLPLFSGFGKSAIVSRIQESSAEFAIVSEFSVRRGKKHGIFENFKLAFDECTSLHTVFVDSQSDFRNESKRCLNWPSEISKAQSNVALGQLEIVDAECPFLLIFTSGTTGRPKGALHSHCGFSIKAAQDMKHPMNLSESDTLFWLTDIGWMMGPWVIMGSLIGGMTLALYYGAPDFPNSQRIWNFVAKHEVTFLGISPTLARSLRSSEDSLPSKNKVSKLKAIGSTGSPWDFESWNWIFEHVLEKQKPIINYSGGTEISGGILCGNFHSILKPCSFSGPILGMNADVFDSSGNSVREKIGELVIKNRWIGMTRGFWKNDERYSTTYWSSFKNTWVHGDNAIIDSDGLWYIVGRSDDTIKVAGKRLGPAEVESIVNSHENVSQCAAIGVEDSVKGECLVVYCVLKENSKNTEENETIKTEIKTLVAKELGKPLTPKEVRIVNSLPHTRNAKIMHRIIRTLYQDSNVSRLGEISSLENLDSLGDIVQYR